MNTIYGRIRNLVQGYTFGPITANFIVINLREKKFFETWIKDLHIIHRHLISYYDDYVGNVKIYQLDQKK